MTDGRVVFPPKRTTPLAGEKAGDIVDAYAKNFPKARPIELWALIVSNRQNAVAAIDA